MKKLTAFILAAVFLLGLIPAIAAADGSSWYCSTCGTERTTEYCPDCGSRRPDAPPSGTWPYRDTTGTPVSFRNFGSNSEQRHQSYYGPGKQYAQAGAYKPYKVKTSSALFQEGDYVLVNFDYQTAGKHCVYFKASDLANRPYLENVTLTGHPAKTTTMLIPMCGPGTDYEYVTQRKKSKYATYDVTTLCGLFGDTWFIYQKIVKSYKDDKFCVYLESGTRISVLFEGNGWVFAEFNCEAGLVRAWLPVTAVEAV